MQAIFDAGVVMRDHTRLSGNVFLPEYGGNHPAVLVRTCYNKSRKPYQQLAAFFCEHKYAFAAIDVRGRGDSDGDWQPWENEFRDGFDAIEWIAQQPWSNGKVATLGGSYEAWVQWAAANMLPPHLTTMITSGSPGHWFHDWPYRGGALAAADYLEWLNLTSGRTIQPPFIKDLAWIRAQVYLRSIDNALGREMPYWQTCLDHTCYDSYWQQMKIDAYAQMDFPVLHITGFYDACAAGQLHHFQQMKDVSPAKNAQHLLFGPWDHHNAIHTGRAVENEHLGLNSDANINLRRIWLQWLDHWMKGKQNEVPDWRPVRYYAMGAGGWRVSRQWPPSDAQAQCFYLHADGQITRTAKGKTQTRGYVYQPTDPATPLTDLSNNLVSLEWFPYQTGGLTQREDVLAYTSAPMEDDLQVAGPVEAHLTIASSAVDTDFVVILADLHPDGRAVMLSQGILRASFRGSKTEPSPLQPGKITSLKVQLSDIAHVFRPRHSMQILITSSLFPWFHPNPNSGKNYGEMTEPIAASQTVYHDGTLPSYIKLWCSS